MVPLILALISQKKKKKTRQQSSVIFLFYVVLVVSCGTLVPSPGLELQPWAWKAQNPNHWTALKSPWCDFFFFKRILKNTLYFTLRNTIFGCLPCGEQLVIAVASP